MPVARFVLSMKSKALEMLRWMEACEKITNGTFRCMEALSNIDDYKEVVSRMDPGLGRATPSRLRAVFGDVVRSRNWGYLILHPELGADYIHPSRSVFPVATR